MTIGTVSDSSNGNKGSLYDNYIDGVGPGNFTVSSSSGSFQCDASAANDDTDEASAGQSDSGAYVTLTVAGPVPEDLPDSYTANVSLQLHLRAECTAGATCPWDYSSCTGGLLLSDGVDSWSVTESGLAEDGTIGDYINDDEVEDQTYNKVYSMTFYKVVNPDSSVSYQALQSLEATASLDAYSETLDPSEEYGDYAYDIGAGAGALLNFDISLTPVD